MYLAGNTNDDSCQTSDSLLAAIAYLINVHVDLTPKPHSNHRTGNDTLQDVLVLTGLFDHLQARGLPCNRELLECCHRAP